MPYSTPAIAHIYGHTPDELAADISLAISLTHPEDRTRVTQMFRDRIRNKAPIHDEWRVLHPAKGEIWVEARGTPKRSRTAVLSGTGTSMMSPRAKEWRKRCASGS